MALCGQSSVFLVQANGLITPNSVTGDHRSSFVGTKLRPRSGKLPRSRCSIPYVPIRGVASEPKPKQGFEEGIPAAPKPTAVDSPSIASNIKYHAEFTPHFSPFKFELPEAYVATAESVRDSLIRRWNEIQEYYDETNPKQTYYLSMEFLQGRALLNAIGNLELRDAYAEALSKLGSDLESVAEQRSFALMS
eukprot:Gb_26802 [translate_table: standard]